ncbi:MAG: gliding motility-associated C-terminal domain-containing protein, partial [Bacteroidota bacterium]
GVTRYNHGTSFSNNPVSSTYLTGFGMTDHILGIKIIQDNGQWIGFVCNDDKILRLNFGASLSSWPTGLTLGPYPMLLGAHCIDILKENGNWVGYLTCSEGNKLTRLTFGNSLLNAPMLTDLGTVGGSLNMPYSFRLINETGLWYALVANSGNNTLTRLAFGASLINDPTGVNLGAAIQTTTPGGLTLIRDCESTTGFQLNYSSSSPDLIWRLNFPDGITGPVTGTSLGDIGNMSRPAHFSELFRVGDILFLYNTNRDDFTLTRLRFLPCTNASVPSSTLYNPPPFSYDQPGTYNVQLMVNEGLPTQASVCKSITVLTPPVVNLGPDITVCQGKTVTFDAGTCAGCSYLWSTLTQPNIGIDPTFTTGAAGVYSVRVSRATDCFVTDNIQLLTTPPSIQQYANPTLSYGTPYFAGGAYQTQPGIYQDIISVPGMWDYILQTNLSYFPKIPLSLGNDTTVCQGSPIVLKTGVTAASYVWQDGSANPTFTVSVPGDYSVTVTQNGCTASDQIRIGECPPQLWFPNAFTPNGDGINDTFHPVGTGIGAYHILIYNRWGELVFESTAMEPGWDSILNGELCSDGVYVFVATYQMAGLSGETLNVHGSVTLLR